jgi:AraC family transcriptional regulator, arabinose operon regulatory protein
MINFRYTSEFSIEDPNRDLKLYYCGEENCKPSHSWGPGLKDHYKIHYIFSGQGTFINNGHSYSLGPGQGFLICPKHVASYKADDKNPWTYAWVAFNGKNARMYLNKIGLSLDNPIYDCDQGNLLQECFNQMFNASKNNKHYGKDLRLLSFLYLFLSILTESSNAAYQPKKTNPKEYYINRAMEFIQTNYSREIGVNEIATYLGLNRNYMTKIFNATIGMTPQTYLIEFRMDKACELLKETNLSIGEISNSIGYSDLLLFSRMFKRRRGLSPKNYRNKLSQ